jgi:hypothetical protein
LVLTDRYGYKTKVPCHYIDTWILSNNVYSNERINLSLVKKLLYWRPVNHTLIVRLILNFLNNRDKAYTLSLLLNHLV